MIMKHDPLLLVLQHRYAGKAWCYNGDGIEGLRWSDETRQPTEAELLSQLDEVMKEIEATNQARQAASVSARAKLSALGLTEAELAALLGA